MFIKNNWNNNLITSGLIFFNLKIVQVNQFNLLETIKRVLFILVQVTTKNLWTLPLLLSTIIPIKFPKLSRYHFKVGCKTLLRIASTCKSASSSFDRPSWEQKLNWLRPDFFPLSSWLGVFRVFECFICVLLSNAASVKTFFSSKWRELKYYLLFIRIRQIDQNRHDSILK